MRDLRPMERFEVEEPIFLVGTTRSGTTLLSLMLGHHPDIAFVGELEWLWDFHESAEATGLGAYYDWLATHRHFLHHRLRVDRALTLEDLARSFVEQMRSHADPGLKKRHVGCQVHRHYARALAVWPRARFVHIVRDGRDVCASWMKFGWLGNAYTAGLRWRSALAEWAAVKELVEPERRIELRFEELVQHPERELARLCAFAGTPYADSMMRYHEDTTYEPLDAAQSGKWRKQLSVRAVRLFEAVASRDLSANGYALSGEPAYQFMPWSNLLLRLEDKLLHHLARARLYGPKLWLSDILARRLGMQSLQARVRLALNQIETARMK